MTGLVRQLKPRQNPGLLPDAHLLVLPADIAYTIAPARIAVAEKLGLGMDGWQQDVSRVLWARRADGSPAADTVCLSVPRQAGKTYTIAANVMSECLIEDNLTVAWTAHHNKVMLETFGSLRALAQQPLVAAHVSKVNASAENRSITFTNGSRIVMAARESGALRGVAKVGILVLDEAQILSDSAMSDILPTQNAADNALTLMMGTPPRPKDPSEAWSGRRKDAVEAFKAGRPLELAAWIEFSADEDAETDDHAQWRKANPSFPKRTPLRALRKLRRDLTEDHFRREALGIWDDTTTPAVIPPDVWAKAVDEKSVPVERLVFGVDISPDRQRASVVLAGLNKHGRIHVELDQQFAGVEGVLGWLERRCAKNDISAVVVDAKGPASTLLPALRKARLRPVVTNTDDMANACAGFFDAAISGELCHINQAQLTESLFNARKRAIGDRWAWNRKDNDSDITPIVAATLACWGVASRRVKSARKGKTKGVVLSW